MTLAIPSPAGMPARLIPEQPQRHDPDAARERALRAERTLRRRFEQGRARSHSIVRFLTRTGRPAGETTVRRDIAAWIDAQTGRGWSVDEQHDDGSARLTRPSGEVQLIGPRFTA